MQAEQGGTVDAAFEVLAVGAFARLIAHDPRLIRVRVRVKGEGEGEGEG